MQSGDTIIDKIAPAFHAYECQGALFRVLVNDFIQNNGVHAYVISGEKGIGKKTLARLCGQALLCTGERKPCGKCPQCQRYQNGTHPDVLMLAREKDRASIGVEAMRELISKVGWHTYEGGKRIVMIDEAELLTVQAQNCFLKTLEEPLADVVFFLITSDTTALLPTIVSRCRALRLHPWPDEYVVNMLTQSGIEETKAKPAAMRAGGNLQKAVAWASDSALMELRNFVMQNVFAVKSKGQILAISNQLKDDKGRATQILDTLEGMIQEMLLVQTQCLPHGLLTDYPSNWQAFAMKARSCDFTHLFESILRARKQRENQVNWQVVFETLLENILEEINQW